MSGQPPIYFIDGYNKRTRFPRRGFSERLVCSYLHAARSYLPRARSFVGFCLRCVRIYVSVLILFLSSSAATIAVVALPVVLLLLVLPLHLSSLFLRAIIARTRPSSRTLRMICFVFFSISQTDKMTLHWKISICANTSWKVTKY